MLLVIYIKSCTNKYVKLHKEIFGDYHDEMKINGEYNSDSVQFPQNNEILI